MPCSQIWPNLLLPGWHSRSFVPRQLDASCLFQASRGVGEGRSLAPHACRGSPSDPPPPAPSLAPVLLIGAVELSSDCHMANGGCSLSPSEFDSQTHSLLRPLPFRHSRCRCEAELASSAVGVEPIDMLRGLMVTWRCRLPFDFRSPPPPMARQGPQPELIDKHGPARGFVSGGVLSQHQRQGNSSGWAT